MIKKFFFLFSFFLVLGCYKNSISEEVEFNRYQEISNLVKSSKNNSFSNSIRNDYLSIANSQISMLDNDSLKIRSLIKLAYSNLLLGNLGSFKNINYDILEKAESINDTLSLARAESYLGYYYQCKFISDSSFYFYSRGLKSFSFLNQDIEAGKILLNMAIIQENAKDYTGGEINCIKAISKFDKTKEYSSLYLIHNTLAVIYSKIGNFILAIENNEKSIEYLESNGGNIFFKAMSLNNIGWIYIEMKDYSKSIEVLNQALETKGLFENRPQTYATLIDNLAYSKFKLGDHKELPALFYKSLQIRDSLQILDGIVESNLHLSEYYLSKKDILQAVDYASKAKNNAKKADYNDGLLESYLLLSKIEPKEKGLAYLNSYIKLSDSLQQKEREIREKFTRIAYETDEITKENKVIAKKNWWLTIVLIIGGVLSTVIYLYLKLRSKNRELSFEKKQDEANIEIYNLMISEKSKFQEGSVKERTRISEELHDGVVSKLFGARLGLSIINKGTTEEDINERESHIKSLREIEEEIRTVSHDLKVEIFNVDNSFENMVEELALNRAKIANFEWKLNFNVVFNWGDISNKIKIHCYRALQETLHNIHKYAKANNVEINFLQEGELLLVEIIDDGEGFNPKNKTKGIGLKNIESRVTKLNGEVQIISSRGNGTIIKMTIPLV